VSAQGLLQWPAHYCVQLAEISVLYSTGKMPIPHYGVWVGKPTRYTAETATTDPRYPHIHLYFSDSSSKEREAAIKVKSIDRDTRLVFWLSRATSPTTNGLSGLDLGFKLARSPDVNSDASIQHGCLQGPKRREQSNQIGLDFLRTKDLVNSKTGMVLPHDIPGPDNDILDELSPILESAIEQQATSYIFGSSFGSGIHDIHMNQGSLPRFDKGTYEDGAILFQLGDHWEAVFLAFASQRLPTDARGNPDQQSRSLAVILGQEDSE
jgi:uncharacterized protein YukJ